MRRSSLEFSAQMQMRISLSDMAWPRLNLPILPYCCVLVTVWFEMLHATDGMNYIRVF